MKTPGHKIKCVICGGTFEEWGNNAMPVKKGTCCDSCNRHVVIPARLEAVFNVDIFENI
ncbi:MAG: hypothetical protein IJL04_01335 [Bacteroidales bacterium]|nr:hypothetical protein [Bacteroidales bacterium]